MDLTCERVKKMPITMQVIKAIKEKYGVPEYAHAITLYGFECMSLNLYGINATTEQLMQVADQYRTDEMKEADEDTMDVCSVYVFNNPSLLKRLPSIVDVFKEV